MKYLPHLYRKILVLIIAVLFVGSMGLNTAQAATQANSNYRYFTIPVSSSHTFGSLISNYLLPIFGNLSSFFGHRTTTSDPIKGDNPTPTTKPTPSDNGQNSTTPEPGDSQPQNPPVVITPPSSNAGGQSQPPASDEDQQPAPPVVTNPPSDNGGNQDDTSSSGNNTQPTPPVVTNPPAGNGGGAVKLTPEEKKYLEHDVPIVNALRSVHDSSLAQAIVGRAIWYMEYGYMKYGHTSYASTGYIDCSQYVSRIYGDFGFKVTSASKAYDQVGTKVQGVSVRNGKIIGADKLQPGDIFTFWKVTKQLGGHIGHVGMYLGQVNGKPCVIMTTPGRPSAIGIVDDFNNWYGQDFHDVRRVLPSSAFTPGGVIHDKGPVIPAKYQIKPKTTIVMPKDLPAGF